MPLTLYPTPYTLNPGDLSHESRGKIIARRSSRPFDKVRGEPDRTAQDRRAGGKTVSREGRLGRPVQGRYRFTPGDAGADLS